MKTFLIVSLAAFTAPAVAQQQTHYSSPRGLLTIDGNSEATHFGGFSNARYMFFDGEQRNSVIVVREVAYRLDQRIYSSTSGAGRSWSAVTLNASDCYINEATTTFSNNQASTPTQVFSGKVTWPSITSRPASNPATWGGAKGAYRFPFSTAWISVGRRDICLDYDFSGGSLENGAAWSSSTMKSYYLDGYTNVTHAQAKQTVYGKGSSQGGCVDSATTSKSGAYGYLDANSYGPTYQIKHFRNKHEIYSRSYYTAPGKPVVHVLGFGGTATGATLAGVSCNKLYVDPNQLAIYFFKTAGSTSTAYTYNSIGLVTYNEKATGLPLWWQAAWGDSSTGQLHLTRAVKTSIPAVPKRVMRQVLYQNDPSKKGSTGYGPYDYSSHNPVVRYTTQ